MAQIAPIVTLLGAGASLYSTARQAQAQSSQARQQAEAARTQEQARTQQVAVQQAADQRAPRCRRRAAGRGIGCRPHLRPAA